MFFYVEDDDADVDLAQTVVNEIGCEKMQLDVVGDGEGAIKKIEQWDQSAQANTPDIVLLDLNLPKVNGKDVLRAFKTSTRLRSVPVVILSTSRHQNDIDETYRLGSAGFFSKPAGYHEYKNVFKAICDYWVRNAQLPSHPSPVASIR